ncbi:hypothetical protein BCR36DRAFT_318200 [Piromyces finnis]|uniref:SH3 domain-containing protein n=1 Tax=Piromyces finnis TaxID=1754191 RepID=A0A1Y1VM80_9FUNG|nr:hypothetical protein BCR36DRAFT_318200 [Piromyces finnis]|eukprot:ORX58607.1 hypothetical protein BCR36DRAFT_318200 [Piromyces finnis]
MSDCVYFQTIIKELNPADTNTGDCCTWSMVGCDNNGNIEKIDFSNYNGISTVGPFPQTIAFLTHLREFSIRGQQNINDIYTLSTENLEKVDLSNSGISSANFPTFLYDATKLKELDISNTKITGMPQRAFQSNISGCNFSNTPICASYESSPYDFIPDVCKSSCKNGASGNFSNSFSNNGKSNGTKVWPYILIGVAALLIIGALGFFLMSRKGKKGGNNEDRKSILPIVKNEEKKEIEIEEEQVEINIKNEAPSAVSKPQISPFVASGPPAPASDINNEEIEEAAINNYNNAYGGNVSNNVTNEENINNTSNNQKDANTTFEQENIQAHPSLYNTMTTDNDDDDEQNSKIINQPILINAVKENPTLLRRKSSRRSNVKVDEKQKEPVDAPEELFVANWDYAPSLSDELELKAGDVIEIKKKFDDGWCNGYNRRTNKTGIVPLCYLKEYED